MSAEPTASDARDELGAALGYTQSKTRVWFGACSDCGARASVSSLAWSCDVCGTRTLEAARVLASLEEHQGIVRLSDVVAERVRWLWRGRIPLGRLTVLDGDPGLGKSTVTLDIAARVTRGDSMPDGSAGLDRPRGVVLLGAEDGLADTVRPRLDAAGADCRRVAALQEVRDADGRLRLPTVADVDAIRRAAKAVDAALLVIDPLSAYLGKGVDGHRDTDVRRALADLAALAEATKLAVLVARHLSKAGGSNPLYRGGGSIAIIAAARSGLLLARDPDDDDRRVLAVTKSNLAAPQPSLSLRLDSTGDSLRVEWLGESEQTAHDLLRSDPEHDAPARDAAEDFLRAELEDGPKPANALQKAARSAGIAWRTVERAKARLGVVSRKSAFHGGWVWEMPPEDRQPPDETPTPHGLADFAKSEHLSQKTGLGAADSAEDRLGQSPWRPSAETAREEGRI